MNNANVQRVLGVIDTLPDPLKDLPGEVFSSGVEALAPGELYIVGLNPMFGTAYPTIREHVANWRFSNFSSFRHQCWNKACWDRDCFGFQEKIPCSCDKGASRHQKAVMSIIKRATDRAPTEIFATNALFACSRSADTFKHDTGYSMTAAFKYYWRVHQELLAIVRPKVIISLGYAEGASAYSFFRIMAGKQWMPIDQVRLPNRRFASYKWAQASFKIEGQTLPVTMIGVRHPSYVQNAADTPEFSQLVRQRQKSY